MSFMKNSKALLLVFFVFVSTTIYSQDKLYELYRSRDFEKCLKKSDAFIEKNPQNAHGYWVKAVCLWEMAQLPSKYKDVEERPVEECLRALASIRKFDDDFLTERADTMGYMKEFAEEQAKEYAGVLKTKSIRMYKLMTRAFEGNINTIKLAEIYIRAEDFDKAVEEITNIYSFCSADVSRENTDPEKVDAIENGILFLVKEHMFNNAFQIVEQYKTRYEDNVLISNSFKEGMKEILSLTYAGTDKKLYFDFAAKVLYLYYDDPYFPNRIEKEIVTIMKESADTYGAIEEPSNWRDTLILRKIFEYADIGSSLLEKSKVFQITEQEISEKYNLHIPLSKRENYKEICTSVVNEFRAQACECPMELYQPTEPLTWNEELEYISYTHAKELFSYNYTDHTNRKGMGVEERVNQTSLKPIRTNTFNGLVFKGAMEVVETDAYGYPIKDKLSDEELKELITKVVLKWSKGKEGQCEALMGSQYNMFGMSVFGDRWVAVFAKVVDIHD